MNRKYYYYTYSTVCSQNGQEKDSSDHNKFYSLKEANDYYNDMIKENGQGYYYNKHRKEYVHYELYKLNIETGYVEVLRCKNIH